MVGLGKRAINKLSKILKNGAKPVRITALVLVVLTAATGLCPSANAAGKIFKWTDANGQVHFDSSPPPGQATEKVRIQKSVAAPAAAPTDTTKPANASSSSTEKPELSPEQRAELTSYCSSMRERISVLKQGGRVNEKAPDGSVLALNAEAVTEKLKADEANVNSYCTANGL